MACFTLELKRVSFLVSYSSELEPSRTLTDFVEEI